jgi:hypothetical protein
MAKAVMRCTSAGGSVGERQNNNQRRKRAAQPKGKTMSKKQSQRTETVPAPPDQVAYSRALASGKTRDEAMAIARKRGAEVVAEKEAAARRAEAYRR